MDGSTRCAPITLNIVARTGRTMAKNAQMFAVYFWQGNHNHHSRFEISIDRPSNLLARAQTYSHYKSHNTVKVLIGITPQGSVCFVSKAWGGRTSDKYLTEHCGMLKNLRPSDLVMAE